MFSSQEIIRVAICWKPSQQMNEINFHSFVPKVFALAGAAIVVVVVVVVVAVGVVVAVF